MGLLDMFLSEEKRIARHTRRVTNRDAQPEDRETSARWLLEHGSDAALMGLLQRFDMNLDHQYKDKAEKDMVFGLVASLGDRAIPCVQSWLRRCRQFAYPLRLLEDLAGRQAAVDMVLEMLDLEYEKDDFKPDKKKALLVWLTDVKDDRCVEAAARFLEDFDEGVRYAAAEVIAIQATDDGAGPMLAALARPEEESQRLRVRIAEVFVARRWPVEDTPDLRAALPEGFEVSGRRLKGSRKATA